MLPKYKVISKDFLLWLGEGEVVVPIVADRGVSLGVGCG